MAEPIGYRPESDYTPPRPDCPQPGRWHADTAGAVSGQWAVEQ